MRGLLLVLAATGGLLGGARWSAEAPQDPEPIGSERGAQVAIDTDGGTKALTFLAGSLSDADVESLRATAPNLRILRPGSRAEALALAPEAHGLDGRYCTPEILRAAEQLVWVQATSAGVERYLRIDELRGNDSVVFTNMQGAHGPTIADHVFAMLLSLTRDLRVHLQDDDRGAWLRRGSGVEPIALHGRTLLVVGLGGIGREVAQRAKGFDMRVLATRRSDVEPPSFVDYQGKPDELPELLAQADVVVICVPLTDETVGMIDADALATMKPGAYLVNIARGKVVDTAALTEALDSGHLAGACLDVSDPEPLPSDHPLWEMRNVVITPHIAGRSSVTDAQWKRLYVENLRRFAAGEPLLNVVDKAAGY